MPYINIVPNREWLDPLIQPIVDYINMNAGEEIYTRGHLQVFCLRKLAMSLYPIPRESMNCNLEQKLAANLNPLLVNLAEKFSQDPKSYLGDLNYCCSQILLLTLTELNYNAMARLEAVCEMTIDQLKKLINQEHVYGYGLITVFRHIQKEFYRRIVVRYEDNKIDFNPKAGDISGYVNLLNLLPDHKKDDGK